MGKISSEGFFIQLFQTWSKLENSIIPVITPEGQRSGTNPVRLILVSADPIYGHNLSSIDTRCWGTFPLKNSSWGSVRDRLSFILQLPSANSQTVRSYKILCLILYDLLRLDQRSYENRGLRQSYTNLTIRFLKDFTAL